MYGSVSGSTGTAAGGSSATQIYSPTTLVANSSAIAALQVDANLVNAWGLAFNPQGFAWIANAGTSTTTLDDGNGNPTTAVPGGAAAIKVPAGASGISGPTGVVFNPTSQFVISSGAASAPALFLYATSGGTIEGWAQSVSVASTVIAYDGHANGSIYTGLAMAQDSSGNNFLYAADFKNGKVDVFNSSFAPVQVGGGFFDASVPQGYVPYGIQSIPSNGSARIYVTFAQSSTSSPGRAVVGTGLGYVAVFDATGTLITHLVSQGALNAPWGIALAPSNFGPLSGALLVGNFGDGAINAYNPTTGASMGPLMLMSGQQLFIPGLWSLQFGNGINGQPTNTLFYTAGPNAQTAGVYGRIDLPGTYTPPSMGMPMMPYGM